MKIFDTQHNPADVAMAIDFLDTPVFQDFIVAANEYEVECRKGDGLYEKRNRLIDAASGEIDTLTRNEVNELLHVVLMQARDEGKAFGNFSDARRLMYDSLFECVCHHNDTLEDGSDSSEIVTYSEVKCILTNIAISFGCRMF